MSKILLPATILIACTILGGFYYASETGKQKSIERQQLIELKAKSDAEQAKATLDNSIKLSKMFCVDEAEQHAIDLNKDACARGEYCIKGENMYLVAQYDNAYKTCLQRKGLE